MTKSTSSKWINNKKIWNGNQDQTFNRLHCFKNIFNFNQQPTFASTNRNGVVEIIDRKLSINKDIKVNDLEIILWNFKDKNDDQMWNFI